MFDFLIANVSSFIYLKLLSICCKLSHMSNTHIVVALDFVSKVSLKEGKGILTFKTREQEQCDKHKSVL